MFKSEHEYFRLGAESYSSLGRVGKSPRLYRLIKIFKIILSSTFSSGDNIFNAKPKQQSETKALKANK